jgi:hypothetical protein
MADTKSLPGDYAEPTGKTSNPENGAARVESNTIAFNDETAQVVDTHAEKKLCRKFDFRLLPVLAIMVRDWKPKPHREYHQLFPKLC